MVDGEAVLQAVRAARVLGDVAADRADLLARRVGRVVEAVRRDRPRDVEVRHARLDDDALAARGRSRGSGSSARARSTTPSATGSAPPESPVPAPRATNGTPCSWQSAHDRLHLLRRAGQDDELGHARRCPVRPSHS